MGQFSWLDCKTERQILDNWVKDVYVLIPMEFGGGHIKETCYDGYGHFGGHDIYDLVVDWNAKYLDIVRNNKDAWICEWVTAMEKDFKAVENGTPTSRPKRTIGIALACYDEDNMRLRYPIKITHDPNARYEECAPSKSDPNQGWLV